MCQVIKMKSIGVILVLCWVALLSNPTNSAATPYPSPYPTSGNPYPTSHYPYSTDRSPYPTSGKPYPTSQNPYPTSSNPYPSNGTTPHPNPHHNATCYGHFIYKEEHNIIVDGEDDRHKNPDECEFACTMVTECRFWKYTMNGEHKGYCELNRGTPLQEGEVVGQRNVKLIGSGKGSYCVFPPNDHHHH